MQISMTFSANGNSSNMIGGETAIIASSGCVLETIAARFYPGAPLVEWAQIGMLGKGSFGSVYEGVLADGRLVAVKVLPVPDDGSSDALALSREIHLLSTLKHKNIVAYYGSQTRSDDEDGAGCQLKTLEIFLEHCHGGSMTTMRNKFVRSNASRAGLRSLAAPASNRCGRSLSPSPAAAGGGGSGGSASAASALLGLPIAVCRSYIRQILEGLCYLHSQRVMHRDIKADNVLLSATGECKLADFGCSKRIGTTSLAAVGSDGGMLSTLVGTPLFMAPEVLLETGPSYSYPADIWSVGCLLIELLGRRPWTFGGGNVFQVMFQISQSKDMPNGMPRLCPPDLRDFFIRCFQRDPAKRASARELLALRWIICPDSDLEEVPGNDEDTTAQNRPPLVETVVDLSITRVATD